MLLVLYFFIINVVIPQIGAYASAAFEPVMEIIILLTGLTILMGSIGMKVSENLGSTIVNNLFRGCASILRGMFHVMFLIIRGIIRLFPRVFRGTRNTLPAIFRTNHPILCNLISATITTLVIAIII